VDLDRIKRLVAIVILLSMAWSAGLVVLAAWWGGAGWRETLPAVAPSLA
jgi:hypothetical protein